MCTLYNVHNYVRYIQTFIITTQVYGDGSVVELCQRKFSLIYLKGVRSVRTSMAGMSPLKLKHYFRFNSTILQIVCLYVCLSLSICDTITDNFWTIVSILAKLCRLVKHNSGICWYVFDIIRSCVKLKKDFFQVRSTLHQHSSSSSSFT